MATPTIHRMTPAEQPAVLAALAAAGGTARTPDSWAHDAMTALILGPEGAPGPVMPLSIRQIKVAPRRTLRVGWLSSNQWPSRMSLRRQTRATAPTWAQLLPELDALLVVRRDAPSLVGRWYAQTGFHSVLSLRCLYLEMEQPPASPTGRYTTRVAGIDELTGNSGGVGSSGTAWTNQMAAVHTEVFGHYGGPIVRESPYWQPALRHHYYNKHYQFQVVGLWSDATSPSQSSPLTPHPSPLTTLMGYAVVGWSGWHSKRPRMDILELATRQWDTQVAEELIRTTCQLAWSENVREVRAVVSVHDPYRSYLMRTGFEDRWGYVMEAKWLHPQRYLDQLAIEDAATAIQINTPGQLSLNINAASRRLPSESAAPPLRIQADEATTTRLLLQRLEVSAALREGLLLTDPGPTAQAAPARLALALPWTPWIFHMLDYI